MMQIVESFLSIQGEGKFSGRLAFFIRFAGCNLNCFGFNVKGDVNNKQIIGCDTLRAVFVNEFKHTYEDFDKEKLLNQILSIKNKNPIVIITGGEPLLHHKNKDFLSFIKDILALNLEIHFETNSTINIDFETFDIYKKCIFAMGIKLSNSNIQKEKRINKEAIKNIVLNSKDSFYKFVIDESILKNNQAKKEIDEVLKIQNNEVYCMPMGSNIDFLQKNSLKVAEFCIENGYNYSDRIHIRIWNDKEKV